MTTLLHLTQSISDMQNELAREQRFSHDAKRNLLNGTKLLREAIDALERDILNNFDERDRSISRMIGNSQPYTTIIDEPHDVPEIEAAKPEKDEVEKAA